MGVVVAVSGKGGAGKTAIAALIIKTLRESENGLILAVDADPNSNLHEALGVEPTGRSIGEIREELMDEDSIPPEVGRAEYLKGLIESSITEGEGFDLITMGRPEGPGCYCYINHLLRRVLDGLIDRYPYVIIDTEAGLEHFSRRTTRDLDVLLVVTDPTARGIETAGRIKELVRELRLKIGHIYGVANRVPDGARERVVVGIERVGLKCIAVVPEDPLINEYDLEGRPLIDLPSSSKAYTAVREMVGRLPLQKAERAWWELV